MEENINFGIIPKISLNDVLTPEIPIKNVQVGDISLDNTIPKIELTFNAFNIENFMKLRLDNIDNPYICHLNVNSLRNKIHDIRFLVSKILPEILTITETKLDNSFPDAQFTIVGYQNSGDLRRDRNKHGGGQLTFVKKGIPCKRLTRIEPLNSEITCAEFTIGKRKWEYVGVYRSPDENSITFFNQLATFMII